MAATRWESHYYYFPKYLDSGAGKRQCSEYSFTWECRELYDEYLKEHEDKLEENFNKADKDMCFICDEVEKVIGRPITYTVRNSGYRHGNKRYIYITPRDLYPNKEDYELIESLFGDTIARVFYPGLLPDEEFYWRTDPKEGYSYDGALWVPHPKVAVLRYDKTIFNNLHIKDFPSNNLNTKEIVTLTPGKKYRIVEYGEETEYRLYPFGFNANGVATLQEHEKIYSWKDRIITSVTKSEEYFKAFLECAKEYANEYRGVVLKKEKVIQNLEKKMDIIMNS